MPMPISREVIGFVCTEFPNHYDMIFSSSDNCWTTYRQESLMGELVC